MRITQGWYIRERWNPQLGTYYVAHGQMSKIAAKSYEKGSIYGSNRMLRFETEAEYLAKLKALKESGEHVG